MSESPNYEPGYFIYVDNGETHMIDPDGKDVVIRLPEGGEEITTCRPDEGNKMNGAAKPEFKRGIYIYHVEGQSYIQLPDGNTEELNLPDGETQIVLSFDVDHSNTKHFVNGKLVCTGDNHEP